ncbi:T9SS type A sorting domain-containing protein [Chryseobacterium sp.]|uniref:T9SS type A sorting domain-containing protein n=1 Tax=Chryseobacterium sp. TaxID=1871047 RepID=UPI0031D6F38A
MRPFSKQGSDIGNRQKLSFEDWVVYPNPTIGNLKILSKFKAVNIEIYDFLGKIIFTKGILSNQEFSFIEIPIGNYHIKVKGNK